MNGQIHYFKRRNVLIYVFTYLFLCVFLFPGEAKSCDPLKKIADCIEVEQYTFKSRSFFPERVK